MRNVRLFLCCLFILGFSLPLRAQSYAGLIDNLRASAGNSGLGSNGWANAGVIGGIPSANWTQCGATIAAYSGTAATISNALAACAANTFVLLGPGTTTLTTGIKFGNGHNNVELRLADGATLVASGAAGAGCQINGFVCMQGINAGDWTTQGAINWTNGFLQGSSTITLASLTDGTHTIVAGSMILLDQCADGYSGTPCAGTEVDNGNFFNCNQQYNATGPTGCAVNGPDVSNQRVNRPQNEVFLVTSVNSGTNQVTLNGTLRHPNWASARTPQAVIIPPITNVGVRGLGNSIIDLTSISNGYAGVLFFNSANAWVTGVTIIKPNYAGIWAVVGCHITVEQTYEFGTTRAAGTDSEAVVLTATSDVLVQNNIWQGMQVGVLGEGPDTGSVFAYNFMPYNLSPSQAIIPMFFPHAGDHYELFEGNVGDTYFGENFHGPKMMNTVYRNLFTAWASCASGGGICGAFTSKGGGGNATTAIRLMHHGRYHNLLFNVLGTPGYSNSYTVTGAFDDLGIYNLGGADVAPFDSIVGTTSYRYGNYDVVRAATSYCGSAANTGFGTTCGSVPEVPTSISPFAQPLPTVGDQTAGQGAAPASLYLGSKPTWFGSLPFLLNGGDVTSGILGQCSGALNVSLQFNGLPAYTNAQCGNHGITASGWAGHVNGNPAMSCALGNMGIPPDGSNSSPKVFNAANCFQPSAPPNPPAACNTCMVAVPLPAAPPIPVLTLSTPAQTYVSSNGFSQDGITWKPSLSLTLTGTGFTAGTTCTFSGTAVPCVCGSSTTCTATVPASLVPIPTTPTQYPPIALANPLIPLPVLQ